MTKLQGRCAVNSANLPPLLVCILCLLFSPLFMLLMALLIYDAVFHQSFNWGQFIVNRVDLNEKSNASFTKLLTTNLSEMNPKISKKKVVQKISGTAAKLFCSFSGAKVWRRRSGCNWHYETLTLGSISQKSEISRSPTAELLLTNLREMNHRYLQKYYRCADAQL